MAKEQGKTSPVSSSQSNEPSNSEVERREIIARSAYFRALSRGFQGGDPLDDWLAAEREVGEQLASGGQ